MRYVVGVLILGIILLLVGWLVYWLIKRALAKVSKEGSQQ